jgi:hypothetical protein
MSSQQIGTLLNSEMPPRNIYNMWQGQRVGSSKNPQGVMTAGFNQIPIGMRLTKKRHPGMANSNVVNVMKKEL